ncbi:response regulator transcription factor [Streptomyces sp. SID5910]|uniref:response regulator transcription factor n=1 Tax=Streptomyces sp. SID5910 TaxID=2690312 RepID=UPI001371C856|nr:response regulator transcription factor [Streptomyces sp. SID5910]MYR46945.1 response regulator [Streptomyces sp. SID5910]
MHALVVDSDAAESSFLSAELQRHGFDAQECVTGAEALEIHDKFDLLLLDLRLPDIDGLEVCRAVRATSDIPLIAFAAGDHGLDRVLCLQAGADDCLAKPYGLRELIARIEAVLRRSGPARTAPRPATDPLARGSLCIDPLTREVRLNGRLVHLTRKEFDLLHRLAADPHTVHSRARLMTDLWGYPAGYVPDARASRTIDTHVSALRAKLGAPDWVLTVRGVGFRFGRA